MRARRVLLALFLMVAPAARAQVGADWTAATGGSIRPGYDLNPCSAANSGALRYNTTVNQFQVCYGSGGWATLADASGTTPFYTDRITSGTAGIFVSDTGVINLRTGGVTTGYLDTAGRLVAPGISITTANGISSTFGSFAKEVQVGTSGATCSSTNEGAIRYASTTLAYCDGSSWRAIFGEGTDPAGFAFTDQLSVNANTLVTSNAVNLGSFAGTLTATCTGCSAIARNGVWGGTTLGGFTAGDTISLRLTSSASYDTALVATATVGSKTSNPWTVHTASLAGPNAFAFTNVSDAATNWTYTSEAVTLTGFTGTLTATCTGCSAIAQNGVWTGGTTLEGFVAGNTIAIRQNTATTTGATTQADVTVGSTTSSPWTLTTATACQAGITVGQECPDGTVYAGPSPDGNVPMYTTRCDAGQTWDGSACTGTRLTKTWNNGTSNWTVTGFTSPVTGKANTAGLVALVDAGAPYVAANYCSTLNTGGHTDWYLPSKNELSVLYGNKATIGNFNESGSVYWAASEYGNGGAWHQRFSDGVQLYNVASSASLVRCVRR